MSQFPEVVFKIIPYFSGNLQVSVVHPGTYAATVLYARNICEMRSSELYDLFRFSRACNNRYINRRTVGVPESLITFAIHDSTPVYIFLETREERGEGETFEMSLTILPNLVE